MLNWDSYQYFLFYFILILFSSLMLISTTKLISHPINLASHHLKKQCSLYGWDPLLSTGNYHNIANQLCYCCLVTELCPALVNPMDCSSSSVSVKGIFQARILEWVAISFSWGSSPLRDWTCVSYIAGRFFTRFPEPPGKIYSVILQYKIKSLI